MQNVNFPGSVLVQMQIYVHFLDICLKYILLINIVYCKYFTK